MLTKNTVFILGAGAHSDLKMPLGYELASTIASKTKIDPSTFGPETGGDRELMQAACMCSELSNNVQRAARAIHTGITLSNSIDDFLHLRRTDAAVVKFGKLAIVKSILEREAKTALRRTDRKPVDFSAPIFNGLWQTHLIKLLSREPPDKLFRNVTFINFNYDRCLEKFFLEAVMSLHGLNLSQAAPIVKRFRIFHPYGQAGQLPELGGNTQFGSDDSIGCIGLAEQIKTYTEEIDVTNELRALHLALDEAQTIIFLGFAFHQQNIELLSKCGLLRGSKNGGITRIFATATNVSNPSVEVMKRRITSMFDDAVRTDLLRSIEIRNDLSCSTFFSEYGAVLSEF